MSCHVDRSSTLGSALAAFALALTGCGSNDPGAPPTGDTHQALLNRAYVVNKHSDELVVIDLRPPEEK